MIIKVKRNTAEIQHTNKKKHIIQLFTKKTTNITPDLDRCKADKYGSLFVTYIIIDPTFI